MFYCSKIISSKTGLQERFLRKIFGRKFFMVGRSFPRKEVWQKILRKIIGRKFFMVAKFFPLKYLCKKKFWKSFWSKIFFGCKIISSKTGLLEKIFSQKFLWLQIHFLEYRFARKIFSRKCVMVAKSFPRK